MNTQTNSIYNISIQSIDNKLIKLQDYKGLYMLFVNVASYCGYTKQYSDLQKLQDAYQNLEVVGLPCNQFLFQEPFSEKKIKQFCTLNYGINFLMTQKIKQFCTLNYGINFLMTQKIKVKGNGQHKLYKWLTSSDLNNRMDSIVKWNFQKYLISKNGELIDFFSSNTPPCSNSITKHLI